MKKALTLVIFCVVLAFGLNQQLDEYALFGRGAGSSGDWGLNSLWGNPAGVGRMGKLALTAGWQNLWGVSEYSQFALGGIYSTKFANFGAFVNYFGNADIYSELVAGAVLGRQIPRIYGIDPSLGLMVKYIRVGSPEPYGSASVVFLDGGLDLFFSSRACLGIYAENLFRTKFVGYDANYMYSVGFRYIPASWVSVAADLQVGEDGRGELYLSQSAKLARLLKVSFGLGGRPTKFYLGAEFTWKDFALGWGGTIHPELGMSNGAKILWQK